MEIEVDFDHESIRDLAIELESPSGSVSRLVAPFDTRDLKEIVFILGVPVIRTLYVPLDGKYRFGSAKHLGEDPNGTWELRVRDHFGGKSGTLRSWRIRVYGHPRDLLYGEPDREVLVALYNATDGPNWANNTNWLSARSLGEWHGVTTDANGRVTRLNLSTNQLIGTIPPELGNLANLQSLDLWGNQLSGGIPPSLGSLANLQGLVLGSNKLTGPIPLELGSLANLQSLDLSYNQLTGTIPASLAGLSNLRQLYLGDNQLTGPVPSWLGSLTHLEELSLSQNQLTGTVPASLAGLSNLRQLDLDDNQLTGPVPSWLGSLTHLEELSLSQNQLTGTVPASLAGLSNLRQLDLDDNQLTGTIPTALGSLVKLEQLALNHNQLTGTIPRELGDLVNLQRLRLNDNQLTGGIPAELGGLAELKELYLSQNQLTGCIPAVLRDVADNDLGDLGLPFCGSTGTRQAAAITGITHGTDSLVVTWAAPGRTGGSAVTAYDLRYIRTEADETAASNWSLMEDVWTGTGSLQYVLTGLTGGTQYDVQVRAVDSAGEGPWSATATGTPGTWGATRSFSQTRVDPGGTVTVTISASGYGAFGQVVETLPPGFGYVSSSLSDAAIEVAGQQVTFILAGDASFTYTITASNVEGSYSFNGVLQNVDNEAVPVGGALSVTVGAAPNVELGRPASSSVRLNSPVHVTATFSEPVFGFTIDDIKDTVVNGTVGNFAGGDGGTVYTFGVTPIAVAEVTVDIPAGVTMDADGNGNMPALQLSFIPYDDDGDAGISKDEAIAAVRDYFAGRLTKDQTIAVIRLYFSTPATAPATVPEAPTGLTATGNGRTRIDLSWAAPASDGGAGITGYRIEVSSDRSAWSELVANTNSTATIHSHSHSGLTAGSTRHYRVSAINASGAGPPSNIATGTTEPSTALSEYASRFAGGPGAVYDGDITQLVGPAASRDQGDFAGNVPMESLERNLWIYESGFYKELIEKARLTDPTPLTTTGETITIQHACINRVLLPCKLLKTYFAPNLLERTDGQIEFTISSFTELGLAGPDTLSLLTDGTLESATVYGGYIAGMVPGVEIQNLWGIYSSPEQEFEANQAIIRDIEDLVLAETGGVILNHNWYAGNDQFLFCREKIDTVDGFLGKKTRSHSAALSDWINGMGASAHFVVFAEVYTAIELGILDCGVTGADAGHGQRWYEVADYTIGPLLSFSFVNNVINGEIWAAIPKNLQQIILEEAAKSELEALRIAAIQNETGLLKNQAGGLEFVPFSEEINHRSFNTAVIGHVIPAWVNRIGDANDPIITETFNNKVGPIVGLRIEPDGSVTKIE